MYKWFEGDSDVGDIVWLWPILDVGEKTKMLVTFPMLYIGPQPPKSVTSISKSPTYFVSNIRHQHRWNQKMLCQNGNIYLSCVICWNQFLKTTKKIEIYFNDNFLYNKSPSLILVVFQKNIAFFHLKWPKKSDKPDKIRIR